jgi:nitrogen fixation-related uncharacterized protein
MEFFLTLISVVFGMLALYTVLWAIDQRLHARKERKMRRLT